MNDPLGFMLGQAAFLMSTLGILKVQRYLLRKANERYLRRSHREIEALRKANEEVRRRSTEADKRLGREPWRP